MKVDVNTSDKIDKALGHAIGSIEKDEQLILPTNP